MGEIYGRSSPWARRGLITIVVAYLGALLIAPLIQLTRGALAQGVGALLREIRQPDVLHAFGLTLSLVLGAVALNSIFGLIVAWVLVKQNFPGKGFLNALVDLPFAVSSVVAGYMVILLFGRMGWFAGPLSAAGIQVVFAWPGMLLATTFVSLPFVVREVMPVLQELGPDQEEAAATLGANPWQTFWRVTLPGIRWGLVYGVTLTAARALGEFGALLVVSGAVAGHTETATLFVWRALDERMSVAAFGVSLVLVVFSFVLLQVFEFFQRRRNP